MPTVLRITSKKANFRRAGITHPATSVDHPVDKLTPKQIEALKKEPMLVVHEVEVDDKGKSSTKKAGN